METQYESSAKRWPGASTRKQCGSAYSGPFGTPVGAGVRPPGTLGPFFFIKALALATAAALAPYTYVQIGFAMLAGWLAFAHTPDGWAVAGMLVIGLSGFVSGVLRARRVAAPHHTV